jgi:preprotein translocase subunit YajC
VSNFTLSRRKPNALPIIIGVVIVISMLPANFLGWTRDLSDLVRIPVTPISHVGMMLTSWIRPAVEPSDLPTDDKNRTELAVAERDHYRQLYHAQMLRATELADQLRELQSLPETALRNPQPPVTLPIDITGIRASIPSSIVELKLTSEYVDRIQEGDIVIVGRDIVGRVIRVGMTRIEVMPSTNNEIGLVRAAIVPAHLGSDSAPLKEEVLVRSDLSGGLYAEVLAKSGVVTGDLVILDDTSWPEVGSGLVLGVVSETAPLDASPLRHTITIVPRRNIRDLTRVVVLGSAEPIE